MKIYVDPTRTPARLMRKSYKGDSLMSLKANGLHTLTLKNNDHLPLDVVIMGQTKVRNLRIGAKLKETAHSSDNHSLLMLGEVVEGVVEGSSTRFSLNLNLNTVDLEEAFDDGVCHILALSEVTWQEEDMDGEYFTRVSETLPTVIFKDILRGGESTPAGDSPYPLAEDIVTKDLLRQDQDAQDKRVASAIQTEVSDILARLDALENSAPEAALPAWIECIRGDAGGITGIKLKQTARIGTADGRVSGGFNPVLTITPDSSSPLTNIALGGSGTVGEISVKAKKYKLNATEITYLDAAPEAALPAWVATVEGDAGGVSKIPLKSGGAGIVTARTADSPNEIPLLYCSYSKNGSTISHSMYLGSPSVNDIRFSCPVGDVYLGQIYNLIY